MIEMDQNGLATAASVSRGVVIDFEKGKRTPGSNNLSAIVAVLEAAGIVFLPAGEIVNGGPGVRLGIKAATAADLTRKIDQLEEQLATPVEDGPPSPERALKKMDEARNQEITTRLKARRAKLKDKP